MYTYSMPSQCQAAERELVHHSNCLQVRGKKIKALLYRCACLTSLAQSSALIFFYVAFIFSSFFFHHFNYSRENKEGGIGMAGNNQVLRT